MVVNNDLYKIFVQVDDVPFDYYTPIKMYIQYRNKKILMVNENALFLYNLFDSYVNHPTQYILDNRLNPNRLGEQLNRYYFQIWTNMNFDDLVISQENFWIGEKYCCFTCNNYATWIFIYNNSMQLLITRLYGDFTNIDCTDDFQVFIKSNQDVFKSDILMDDLVSLRSFFKKRLGTI